jgi:hypothetical protein
LFYFPCDFFRITYTRQRLDEKKSSHSEKSIPEVLLSDSQLKTVLRKSYFHIDFMAFHIFKIKKCGGKCAIIFLSFWSVYSQFDQYCVLLYGQGDWWQRWRISLRKKSMSNKCYFFLCSPSKMTLPFRSQIGSENTIHLSL